MPLFKFKDCSTIEFGYLLNFLGKGCNNFIYWIENSDFSEQVISIILISLMTRKICALSRDLMVSMEISCDK